MLRNTPISSVSRRATGAGEIEPSPVQLDTGIEVLAGQNQILEMVATGRPTDEILAEICRLVEAIEPRAVVSVLVLNRARRCFDRVVTPSLDPAYSEALRGAPIDPPHLGTCGAAVFFGEPVTSLDIATDARWHATWRELCLGYGLRACQSTPLLASDGTPLGSFLVSFREPGTAASWDPKPIGIGTHLASITLEREAKDHALRQAVRDKDTALSMLQAMLDHAPVGFAFFDRDCRYVRINGFLTGNYEGITPAHVGQRLEDVSPTAASLLEPHIAQVFATGEVVSSLEVICDVSRRPGQPGHWLTSLYPVLQDGRVAWVGAVMIDITERKKDEYTRQLLLAELSHRVKNTLAVVQSIVTQTLSSDTAKDLAQRVRGRIQALAHTHTLLSETDWRGAGLGEIVRQELAPYMGAESPRVVIAGPELKLAPRAAQTLGLAIHEMATNAAKYGALSVAEGRVEVRWHLEGEGEAAELRLVWTETGGPDVVAPRRSGFGRRLIEYGLRHDLGGEARLDFHPAGLVGCLRMPARAAVAG